MRPYIAHIGPELAEDIMRAAAQGSATNKQAEAERLWKVTVGHGIHDALIDNMAERYAVFRSRHESGEDVRKDAGVALDDVMAPLAVFTGHDWLGRALANVDPVNDEAVEALFDRASKHATSEAWNAGVEKRGSVNKFLAHEHITLEAINAMTDPNKPFIDFLDNVVSAASETFGDDWTAARLAEGTDAALSTLLQCAGYAVDANGIASLRHAVSLLPADAPTPDFAQTRAEGMEPKATPAPAAAPAGVEDKSAAVDVIRTCSGLGDPEIGELLGVSRGTVGNIAQGKAKKPMTEAGRAALAAKTKEIAQKLLQAADVLLA